jgi:acetyltransferase-like isoleucine patch superfamily enzyme
MGKFSYCVNWLNVLGGENQVPLKIGKFCSIAQSVTVLLGGGHRPDWVTTYPFSTFSVNSRILRSFQLQKAGVLLGMMYGSE